MKTRRFGLIMLQAVLDGREDCSGGAGGAGKGIDAPGAVGLDDLGGRLLDGPGANAPSLGVVVHGDVSDLAALGVGGPVAICLSPETVKTYLNRAYAKVGVTSKQELVALIDAQAPQA